MRSDVLNKNSSSHLQFEPAAKEVVDLGAKKIVSFAGSLAGSTAADTQYADNDIMVELGALDVSVPSGLGTAQKILIEKCIFSCTTAAGQTLAGNIQLSATSGSAENGAVSSGTEIFGAGASMVAPDGSGATTGYTEADLNFNSVGITYASPHIAVDTSLVNVYACTTTTLNADATAGRFSLQIEYSII